ncbi:LysR family transcriptional regulator [Pseudonocardia eucalypti]|uniref:LysR family transcriptional regulator n=1 Tax=Pseudonocardia eucalypti TaxID=648755 RepID=A0ABP9PVI6_9PSEU|nr:DNA-binding transcriptional LysR family regulator [Pseudonocardia eucalypti]
MLSLRQLEYLVTVVDTGSFTRAAAALHVTQPALSHQIRALERTTGGPLLERLPRAVRLTPMGRAMLPHARAALADAARAGVAARQAGGLQCGELDVATIYSVSLGVLPPVLRAWRRDHPDVHVRLLEFRHADELHAAMLAGRADVAVGPAPPDWEGTVRELGHEEFVLVLAADDPCAAGEGPLPLTELADRAWVHYAPGHGLAELVDRACAAVGFIPRAAVRTEQTATAPVLAAAGLGPTLTPENVLPARFDGVVRRPDPPITRLLTGYARAAADPLTSAFLDALERNARGVS